MAMALHKTTKIERQ